MVEKRKNRSNDTLVTGLILLAILLGRSETDGPFAQEAVPSRAGRIVGKVRVEGVFKKPPPLWVYKNRDFCGSTVPNESLIVGPQGSLKNAVVVIHTSETQKTGRTARDYFLDNKNCAFVPHIQALPVGSEILLLNNDPILHTVHARIGSETLFNVGLPTWRQVKKRLSQRGVIRIDCDVLHTWMSAYIVVTSSSYFAVTDEKGEFVIEEVPAGNYEMEVWHEKLGHVRKKVEVVKDRTSRIDFVFSCVGC